MLALWNVLIGQSLSVLKFAAIGLFFLTMNESVVESLQSPSSSDKVELSIRLDSDLLDQITHLTNDPSKIIEVAIRQWLKGETLRDDDLTRTPQRNPPVPPRGEWND